MTDTIALSSLGFQAAQLLADLPELAPGGLVVGAGLEGVSRQLAKYLPVTPSTSGDEAR
jgi:hypothetical protein